MSMVAPKQFLNLELAGIPVLLGYDVIVRLACHFSMRIFGWADGPFILVIPGPILAICMHCKVLFCILNDNSVV